MRYNSFKILIQYGDIIRKHKNIILNNTKKNKPIYVLPSDSIT